MPLPDPFQRKRKALDELSKGFEAIQVAIDGLSASLEMVSPEDRDEFREWVLRLVNESIPARPATVQPPPAAGPAPLPGPRDAVIGLLKQHPDGLTMREIEDALKGKFHTTSPQWRNMLQAAIAKLRRRGRVKWGQGKRHRLVEPPAVMPAAQAKPPDGRKQPAYMRIIQFLLKHDGPASTQEIAAGTGIPKGSVVSVLHTRQPELFRREEIGGKVTWEVDVAKYQEHVMGPMVLDEEEAPDAE